MGDRVLSISAHATAHESLDADGALVQAARTDPHAFGTLYDRYVDVVYRYLYRQTGASEAAEDLTSLTFMRALAGLKHFQASRPFAPWLFRIAHNALVDYRRTSTRTVRLTEEIESALTERADPGADRTTEEATDFLQFTIGLPDDQRDALALRFVADLSTEQTAAALGRSAGAAKMLVARGIATLRARVARDAKEEDQ